MSNSDRFSNAAADYDNIFELIDAVFSLESCLRYQILPLELDEDHLTVGIVDPKDKETIRYISPLTQSLGYTFHTQTIDTNTHQLVLAAYLKRSPKTVSTEEVDVAKQVTCPTLVENVPNLPSDNPTYSSSTLIDIPPSEENNTNYDATLIDTPSEESIPAKILHSFTSLVNLTLKKNEDNKQTGDKSKDEEAVNNSATLVDLPPEAKEAINNSATLVDFPPEIKEAIDSQNKKSINNSATLVDFPPEVKEAIDSQNKKNISDSATLVDFTQEEEPVKPKSKKEIDFKQTIVVERPAEEIEQLQVFSSTPQINNLRIDASDRNLANTQDHSILQPSNGSQPGQTDSLDVANPEMLWQQLLQKIISGEIDKLYFQYKSDSCSILSGLAGKVDPLLKQIDREVFQEVVRQVKTMAKLPPTKIDKHKKVAVPKLYNGERVLLRIEFFPSRYGEEITMQVLQGEALKFYEQRQADRTIEQALGLGVKLERALSKVVVYRNSIEANDLDALNSLVRQIEQKLKSLEP